jgi:beta-galactosidase
MAISKKSFLSGAQYYRAPTPSPHHWENDLALMKELKFNTVKFWVQWRWSHREENRFEFSDLDQLMDLAYKNNLKVTLNTIFDVAPLWLYNKYPDAKMVQCDGKIVEPRAINCRQTGGSPGPCYNHRGALFERRIFMRELIEHFKNHPAMGMWDVWNEPEQNFFSREPHQDTICCYCPNCRQKFVIYLKDKYRHIDALNQIWGRCYDTFEQIELPWTSNASYIDFMDFREFQLDVMTSEAQWRLDMTRELDPDRTTYLHVVPNTMRIFNSITCVDDFALAENCDVFAGTSFSGPHFSTQLASAGHGKIIYNVEVHINGGQTALHPKRIKIQDLRREFIPQIGLGIRGFLYWQFRGESLGGESPAWGLIHPGGLERPITLAVREWQERMAPYEDALMNSFAPSPKVAIWKSRKNEIFHFAAHNELRTLAAAVEGYVEALYKLCIPCRYIDHTLLEKSQLDGIEFIIMPSPYFLTSAEAATLDKWIKNGGTLLTEAHLGGYTDSGRHSELIPGCDLAESWGIHEADTTASIYLKTSFKSDESGDVLAPDVQKALEHFGYDGGRYFPIHMSDGKILCGCSRAAFIEAEDGEIKGRLSTGEALIVSGRIGKGKVIYAGSNLGEGAEKAPESFRDFLKDELTKHNIKAVLDAELNESGNVHIDVIGGTESSPEFIAVVNAGKNEEFIKLHGHGRYRGIFSEKIIDFQSGKGICIPPEDAELYARIDIEKKPK